MQHHAFTERDVEGLLRASEGVASTHRGGAEGHARGRHLLLSNAELLARYEAMIAAQQQRRVTRRAAEAERGRRWKPGGPLYQMVTAWADWADMVEMGCLLLNSPQAQSGLAAMFTGEHAAEGARLEVSFIAPRDVMMRYVQGGVCVRSMPVRQLTMVVDRADRDPLRLHIQTFFGGITLENPYNGAVLFTPQGQDVLGFTGFAFA